MTCLTGKLWNPYTETILLKEIFVKSRRFISAVLEIVNSEFLVYLFFLSYKTQISIIYFLLTTVTYNSIFNFLLRSYESVGHTCGNDRGESVENFFQ